MTKFIKKRGESAIQKIPQYKMMIMNKILESDTLTKLLFYNESDALDKPELEDKFSLLYDRVYPFRFVPDPVQEKKSFITIGLSGFRRYQEGFTMYDDYQAGEVYFYIFTHHDLMRTDNGIRQDLMLAEIEKLFEGTADIGNMGQLKLRYANELWFHNNKFGGYTISFTVSDFS